MSIPAMSQMPNQITLNMYREVIRNVIHSAGDEWKKKGGDYTVLQSIADHWTYETLKNYDSNIPQPHSRSLQRAKEKKVVENETDPLLLIMGLSPQETPEESESSSSESASSGSDLSCPESDASKSESESSDGLGSTEDSEVSAMVEPPTSDNRVYCQFQTVVKKKKKVHKLHVVNAHFLIDGVPRVVKNGIIELP